MVTGPGGFKTEIADDDIGFVHENARALLQFREADARIDVAVIVGAADHDLRGFARRAAEERADAIGRRGHLFDDLLELLDHLARVADHLLLRLDLGAEGEEPFLREIARGQEGDGAIEGFEKADLALVVRRVGPRRVMFAFVAHSVFSFVRTFHKNDTPTGFRPQTSGHEGG